MNWNPFGRKPDKPPNNGVVWKVLIDLYCKVCRSETKHFTTNSSGNTRFVCTNPH